MSETDNKSSGYDPEQIKLLASEILAHIKLPDVKIPEKLVDVPAVVKGLREAGAVFIVKEHVPESADFGKWLSDHVHGCPGCTAALQQHIDSCSTCKPQKPIDNAPHLYQPPYNTPKPSGLFG